MKADDFEQELARQPMKPIPVEWRSEILAAVDTAVNRRPVGRDSTSAATRSAWPSILVERFAALLWPHPKAWAGLAAVWIVVFALNLSLRDPATAPKAKASPPAPEAVAELRRQQRMLVELIGPAELRVASRQRDPVPKPRSEWNMILTA